ncbi:hypothetical protein BGW41_003468 [Actinomortierella wolfii]|nr:hypothetical protein BGW41_003468 [Actinomortierella wolfii]
MAAQNTTLPKVRDIYNLERYHIARGNANTFTNVTTGPRIRASDKILHPQTDDQAEWAQFLASPLTWLIQEHPVLSVAVCDHRTTKPFYARLPAVNLSRIIRVTSVQHPDDVTQVLELEHNEPFDLSDWSVPLWRIIVVRIVNDPASFYLIYKFHHAIGDGRSSMALTEELVQQVNVAMREQQLSKSNVSIIVPSPDGKELDRPMELRTNCNPGLSTLLRVGLRDLLLPGAIKNVFLPKQWKGEIDNKPGTPNITQVGLFKLSKEETSLVVQAAKRHRHNNISNTVQSAIFAAAVFAVHSCFVYPQRLEGKKVDKGIRCETPIALRDLIAEKIGRTEQGTFISELFYNVKLNNASSFWEVAAGYRRTLIDGTQTKAGVRKMLEYFGMLKYLPNRPGDWEEFVASPVHEERHGRRATLLISNLGCGWDPKVTAGTNLSSSTTPTTPDGQSDSTSSPAYVVEDVVFSQGAESVGPTLTYSVATANGILTATNTWQQSAFHDRHRGDWYTRETKRILLQACQPDRTELTLQEAFDAREPCPKALPN